MLLKRDMPESIQKEPYVILFDGVCKLCNGWVNFILKYDQKKEFKLCSVQSQAGKEILNYFGFPAYHYETMLYIEHGDCYTQSTGVLKVVERLGYPWKLVLIFRLMPRALRDWMYDRIAFNRYKLFGRFTYCVVPDKKNESRFIDTD